MRRNVCNRAKKDNGEEDDQEKRKNAAAINVRIPGYNFPGYKFPGSNTWLQISWLWMALVRVRGGALFALALISSMAHKDNCHENSIQKDFKNETKIKPK